MKLVAMMPVRNERGRFLTHALRSLRGYADEIVVLDDASTDGSADLAESMGARVVRLAEPLWEKSEVEMRKRLWTEAVMLEPDWLMAIDADEILFGESVVRIRSIIENPGHDVIGAAWWNAFYSFTHYRYDGFWGPGWARGYIAMRYEPTRFYYWRETRLHCGRLPCLITRRESEHLNVYHIGYARPKDVSEKIARYKRLDSEGRFSYASHYASMARLGNQNPIPFDLPVSLEELETGNE